MRNKRTGLNYQKKTKLLMTPGLVGFAFFSIFPLFWSVYYSLIDNNFKSNFVGMQNFDEVLGNEYYVLAITNTLKFTITGVILVLLFSFMVSATSVYAGKRFRKLNVVFLIPMLLPTSGVAFVWRNLFNPQGALTALSATDPGILGALFAPQLLPLYLIFIWKYSGLNIVLITSAISTIDKEVYEAAALDGASGFKLHRHITAPLIRSPVFFALCLTITNSFHMYREVYYLFDGDYPPDPVYMLQHFMNNQFRKLDFQLLSAGVLIFAVILIAVIAFVYFVSDKKSDY